LYKWSVEYTCPTGRGGGFIVLAPDKASAEREFLKQMPGCAFEIATSLGAVG
jgi:hypothetical protein